MSVEESIQAAIDAIETKQARDPRLTDRALAIMFYIRWQDEIDARRPRQRCRGRAK